MALPVSTQARYWGIAALVFAVVLWFLGDALTPFLLGGAFAYILDPVADRLERLGMRRLFAVITITVLAILVFVLLVLLVVPTLVRQLTQLIETAPELFIRLRDWLAARFPDLVDEGSTIRQQLASIGETIAARGGEMLSAALSSALSFVNVLVLLVIVPVVTFYLLLDWDRMVARIDTLLPREHAPTIRRLASEIDETLSSFIRGQGLVMLIQGTFYAVSLMLVGLQFGVVVGAFAGLVTFIPYVGAIVGGALAIGLALFQFWGEWHMIALVAAIFFGGQFLEGNILTPLLVGDSVGLHPVWLLLALAIFGAIFGFVGLLVAVPVAAMLGVLTRFATAQYMRSTLYLGSDEPAVGE
ncbi:Lipocalin-related protein and Bos/Can/Equ allergen [Oceanicola granulosus HTCC2516]|uniref:Lipocalin-related protein and Bos/Can/Equ allergen n=1 Tax=Oceanicola granulosus (strain ATCC BAA-861 / DSM 15982 / KCTC 12143 / HTCC2516) TaxID=314256 RepID=Q2CCM1_OCEGH|nr:AI-2E family transporter [Oceanicola granulosus]EAR50392.1 Lipocalin-related protein and Bos/Can/Equ allergen [Oceanicola granulosus HTCC2516]